MKSLAKKLACWLASLLVSPVIAMYLVHRAVVGRDEALHSWSQCLSLLPGVFGSYLRVAFLRFSIARCERTARVEFGALLSKSGAILDEHCYVGPYVCLGHAHVGRDVLLASGVQVPSGANIHGTDRLDIPIREQPGKSEMVAIGAGSWIGANAVVMANVGADCIVAAGSVVTKPIPDRSVAAGVPAKIIRTRGEPGDVTS